MISIPIGREINLVPMPHWECIGVVGMRHVFAGVVFEIVESDGLRQSARVTLPGPEIAEDYVVGDSIAIRRIRKQPTLIHRQRLWQTAIQTDGEFAFHPSVRSVTAGKEHNALAVRSPGNDLVVNAHAVAQRLRAALVERELFWLSAG